MRQLLLMLMLASIPAFASGDDTHAGRSLNLSGQASAAGSGSAAHAIAASGQVTSAASALPLSVGGAVLGSAGAVSAHAAGESARAASAPIGKPLPITNENITIMPPDKMLKTRGDGKDL